MKIKYLYDMQKVTEEYIQNQCWIWFKNHTRNMRPKPIIYSVPNDEASVVQAKRKNLTGRLAGVADLVVMLNKGKSIYIEMKTPTGRQQEAQKQFQLDCEALGFEYYICRTLDEFKNVILQHL